VPRTEAGDQPPAFRAARSARRRSRRSADP
jgi:hypothetical protein